MSVPTPAASGQVLPLPGSSSGSSWKMFARCAELGLVEAGRREGEDHYDAYLRMRHEPTATLAALVLILREQFSRERRPAVH